MPFFAKGVKDKVANVRMVAVNSLGQISKIVDANTKEAIYETINSMTGDDDIDVKLQAKKFVTLY